MNKPVKKSMFALIAMAIYSIGGLFLVSISTNIASYSPGDQVGSFSSVGVAIFFLVISMVFFFMVLGNRRKNESTS